MSEGSQQWGRTLKRVILMGPAHQAVLPMWEELGRKGRMEISI